MTSNQIFHAGQLDDLKTDDSIALASRQSRLAIVFGLEYIPSLVKSTDSPNISSLYLSHQSPFKTSFSIRYGLDHNWQRNNWTSGLVKNQDMEFRNGHVKNQDMEFWNGHVKPIPTEAKPLPKRTGRTMSFMLPNSTGTNDYSDTLSIPQRHSIANITPAATSLTMADLNERFQMKNDRSYVLRKNRPSTAGHASIAQESGSSNNLNVISRNNIRLSTIPEMVQRKRFSSGALAVLTSSRPPTPISTQMILNTTEF